MKGEKWGQFVNRYGDWGRDVALYVAQRRGGMKLRELGEKVGGLDYSAVSESIRTFERRKLKNAEVRAAYEQVIENLNLEMRPL